MKREKGQPVRPDYSALIEPTRNKGLSAWHYDREWLNAMVAAGMGRTDIANLIAGSPREFLLPK